MSDLISSATQAVTSGAHALKQAATNAAGTVASTARAVGEVIYENAAARAGPLKEAVKTASRDGFAVVPSTVSAGISALEAGVVNGSRVLLADVSAGATAAVAAPAALAAGGLYVGVGLTVNAVKMVQLYKEGRLAENFSTLFWKGPFSVPDLPQHAPAPQAQNQNTAPIAPAPPVLPPSAVHHTAGVRTDWVRIERPARNQVEIDASAHVHAGPQPAPDLATQRPPKTDDDLPMRWVAKFVVRDPFAAPYTRVYAVTFSASFIGLENKAKEAVAEATRPGRNAVRSITNPLSPGGNAGRSIICTPLGVGRLEEKPSCAAITSIVRISDLTFEFPVDTVGVHIKSMEEKSTKVNDLFSELVMNIDRDQILYRQWESIQWRVDGSRLGFRYQVMPGFVSLPSVEFAELR